MQSGLEKFRNMFMGSGSWYEGADENPYSIVFVVRDRLADEASGNVVVPDEQEAVECSLRVLELIFADYGRNPDTTARIDEWVGSRIRKIVKRAHGAKWNKALEEALHGDVPAKVYQSGTCSVLCFAPMRASEQAKPIKSLQVSGLDLEFGQSLERKVDHALHIVLSDALDMSTGKAIAQYGHAYQMAFRYLGDDEFSEWMEHGLEVDVRRGNIDAVKEKIDCPIEVHDAGFTEIAPGSATAVAYFA